MYLLLSPKAKAPAVDPKAKASAVDPKAKVSVAAPKTPPEGCRSGLDGRASGGSAEELTLVQS